MRHSRKATSNRKLELVLRGDTIVYVKKAWRFLERVLGIYSQPLASNTALWIKPCNSVHTFLCPVIGIMFLDKNNKVLANYPFVLPNRVLIQKGASSVVEYLPESPLALMQPGDLVPLDKARELIDA